MVLSWFDMHPVCSEFIAVIVRQIMKKTTRTTKVEIIST